mgnify:CR=1 FL=1
MKKLFSMALVLIVFATSPAALSVSASATTCKHLHGAYSGVSIMDHWTVWHKGPTEYTVGGDRVYVDCLITYEVIRYGLYCNDCNKLTSYNDEIRETHSKSHQ